MSKYQFHRMKSEKFQEMVQSLLEQRRRGMGDLVQFPASGADGARETTWTQPPDHPDYLRPPNELTDVPKKYIFQVKFHDIGLRGWSGAATAVLGDLKAELEKVSTKYKLSCHHYVLITNVPLTGARWIGTRDKITKVADEWKSKIPCIEVWDAADLSRMLDNNPGVRSSFTDLILPGDVLAALLKQQTFHADRRENSFRGYLKSLIENESKARAEEAGDDDGLPLTKVFIDQTLQLDKEAVPESCRETVDAWTTEAGEDEGLTSLLPEDLDHVSSAFPLLWGAQEKVMLLAGPGYGKSTITQFLAIYHAARIINPTFALALAQRLKLPGEWGPSELDASCPLRFPFRVELRRYAKWRKSLQGDIAPVGIAAYIAKQLIGNIVESSLVQDDIFALIASNPSLLILDGLDEVPNKEDRDLLLKDCDAFLMRCDGEGVDLQIVMSSRPQGYHGEFDRFHPLRWKINDLSIEDFNRYAGDWLTERIKNAEERSEAEERIKRGMASEAVRRLATTLLQATVMLTIVRKKSDIPEERHKLFQKYVDVVFQREMSKNEVVSRYEQELRLLHEMVGYQIHEAVSRGESGTMPEGKFKDTVWTVWRLIRGEERINAIPNDEIKSIYDLATDRLIFLSGKGATQTEIDFVIQPYREYFAANYMANHANVDADKVFDCLVARGPFWQQVLRFFAAMAPPAQRVAWAFGAAISTQDSHSVRNLVTTLPAKRAVVFALPEFGRLQFDQFRKILGGGLTASEWWAWLGQEWVCPILATFRNGDAWRELWKAFEAEGDCSIANKQFALWLFPRVIPRTAPEHETLVQFVSLALQDGQLAARAIEVTLAHELDIGLDLVDDSILSAAIAKLSYTRHARRVSIDDYLRRQLSPSKYLRVVCTNQYFYSTEHDAWSLLRLPVQTHVGPAFDMDVAASAVITPVRPPWTRVVIRDVSHHVSHGSRSYDGEYATYLRVLFECLENPKDPERHRKARSVMRELSSEVTWSFECDSVIGPPPDQFQSTADWIWYKDAVRELFANAEELLLLQELAASFSYDSDKYRDDWIVLLFPPLQWERLVIARLLPSEVVSRARQSKWAACVGRAKEFMGFVSIYRSYPPSTFSATKMPYLRIMRCAIELHNDGLLCDSVLADQVLPLADSSQIAADAIHELIEMLRSPSTLPETWARALIKVAIRVEKVDLELVAILLSEVSRGKEQFMWMRLYGCVPNNKCEAIVERLLKIRDAAAFDLAIQLGVNMNSFSREVASEMNRRIVDVMMDERADRVNWSSMLACLFSTIPTVEEIAVYSNVSVMDRIGRIRKEIYEDVANRITAAPQSVEKSLFGGIRKELSAILDNLDSYPPIIPAAAVDAMIQMDVASCAPLTESEWQS